MNLRKYLIELLKNNTGEDKNSKEIKTMQQNEIYEKLHADYPDITLKKVRTCLKNLVEEEANLPNEEKTICYEERYGRKTNYYYNKSSTDISDVELKYLIDSIMYGKIFNSKQAKSFAKRVQNLSGKL